MPEDAEPTWLKDAAETATRAPPEVIIPLVTENKSIGDDPSLTPRTFSPITPPRVGPMCSVDEEPAWLSHAASHVQLPNAVIPTAFSRATDAARAAWEEFRGLSSTDFADGLLALSVTWTRRAGRRATVGFTETYDASRGVLASTPGSAVRLRDGALQLPIAAATALFALCHAVLAIFVIFSVHTPRAALELRDWAADVARRNGVGVDSQIGQQTIALVQSLRSPGGEAQAPAAMQSPVAAASPAAEKTGDEAV